MKQNRIMTAILVTITLLYAQEQEWDVLATFEKDLIEKEVTPNEAIKYLRYLQSNDEKITKHTIHLFYEHREYLFSKESEEISKKIYPILIELVCNEKRIGLADITKIWDIMASLNKKVSAENIEALSQMIKKIQKREDYEYFIMDIFIKNVIWEGGETFLQLFGDLLQLPDVDTDRLAEIIEKYPHRFQKDIIEQLQKKDKMIDKTIYSMLELSKREDYETVMRIILDLFQNKEIEVIDKESREVISYILMDYFSKYFDVTNQR